MSDDYKDTRITEVRLAEALEAGYGLGIGDFLCTPEEVQCVISALRTVATAKLEILAEQELDKAPSRPIAPEKKSVH
jgi:hypothetical protein